jgi:hypothetical protein
VSLYREIDELLILVSQPLPLLTKYDMKLLV